MWLDSFILLSKPYHLNPWTDIRIGRSLTFDCFKSSTRYPPAIVILSSQNYNFYSLRHSSATCQCSVPRSTLISRFNEHRKCRCGWKSTLSGTYSKHQTDKEWISETSRDAITTRTSSTILPNGLRKRLLVSVRSLYGDTRKNCNSDEVDVNAVPEYHCLCQFSFQIDRIQDSWEEIWYMQPIMG